MMRIFPRWFLTPNKRFHSSTRTLSRLFRSFLLGISLFPGVSTIMGVLLLLAVSTLSLGQTTPPTMTSAMNFPAFRSSYILGDTINVQTVPTIQAGSTTVIAGGTIDSVVFYYHPNFFSSGTTNYSPTFGTRLGRVTSAPYNFNWRPTATGNAFIRAIAYGSYPPLGGGSRVVIYAINNATGTGPGAITGTSYQQLSVYSPNYVTTRNIYINVAYTGSTTNGAINTPYKTMQAGVEVAAPGDTVFVMNGTYTSSSVSGIAQLQRTGLPTQWITIMPYQNHKPVLKLGDTNFNGFNILPSAAYVKVQGFEVIGNNYKTDGTANLTLAAAQAQPGACEGASPSAAPTPKFNGNGISLSGRIGNGLTVRPGKFRPHHIVIANNSVHDCAGGGISAIESDYVTVEDNISYRNCWYMVYGGSGISFLDSWNSDNSTATKMIIRRNRCFANRLFIAWNIGGTGTNCRFYDGNGIIVDNNNVAKNQTGVGYTGAFLIENNLSYQNGGRGININYTDNATVLNNTTYQNGATDQTTFNSITYAGIESEFIAQNSIGLKVYNNIFHGRPGEKVTEVNSTTFVHNNNLTFEGKGTPHFIGNQNITGKNPNFVTNPPTFDQLRSNTNPIPGTPVVYPTDVLSNLQLQGTSPALNKGSSTAGQYTTSDLLGNARPLGAGVDIGAYELTGPAISFSQQPGSGSSVCAGSSVNLSVTVNGAVQSYQWYRDGVVITGNASATKDTLKLVNVTATDAGTYTVVVSGFNVLTSDPYVLTVNALPVPTITADGPVTFCAGGSVSLSTGSFSSYIWKKDGTPVGTDPTYSTTAAGGYTVMVTDANGCVGTSASTSVTVNVLPTVSFSGLEASYCANASAVTLTGSPAGGIFSGTGTSGISFNPATAGAGGPYLITYSYTDGNGCSNTSPAQSVTITQPSISPAATLSVASLCAGTDLRVTFTVNCPTNSTFSAELTDATGTTLGISLGAISPDGDDITVPAGTPTGSYKILVTGTNPTLTSLSGLLSVTGLSANYGSTPTVSSTPACAGGTVRVAFTTRTATCPFPGGTVFTAELSDASGSFASPSSLGTVTAGINANVPIPQATPTGAGYRIRIAATAGGSAVYSASSAAFAVNQPQFSAVPSVSSDNKCAGESVRLSFSIGCAFFSGNTFTAELSNASGSFAAPVSVGTVTPGALNNVVIPVGTPAGTGYKLRIVSSSPLVTSAVSANFKVKACGTNREIAPVDLGLQVRVSPNPSTEGRLRIQVTGAEGQGLKVALFNGLGQTVREQTLERAGEENVLEWDIARQPQGLYLLRVSGTNEAKTVKVIH